MHSTSRSIAAISTALAACVFAMACEDTSQIPAQQDASSTAQDAAADATLDTTTDTAKTPMPAVLPKLGDLLIEELYYSGAAPRGGTDHYFSDQFIELVNTTTQPLDLSGLLIGDAHGAAGAINPGMKPDSYATSRPNEVVLSSVWRIPKGARLEPGARLIIAHDGTNHRPFSTVDLSGAGFETFVASDKNRDDDYLTVDNLESVVFNGGYDWLITVFGASVVILKAGTPLGSVAHSWGPRASAPVSGVLDAVEALKDAKSSAFKRLPTSVDAGFAFVSGTYKGESLHRIQVDGKWQDTDDSSADFVAGPPKPYRLADPQGVYGTPTVEIGVGRKAFASLEDGDDVELVAGIQGGWHVDVSVRLGGFGPDGVLLSYDAVDGDGKRVSYETQALLQKKSVVQEGELYVRLADRVVFDIPKAEAVIGTTIFLRVTAQIDGQTWSDQRRVVVRDLVK